jgi:hypothetical protein
MPPRGQAFSQEPGDRSATDTADRTADPEEIDVPADDKKRVRAGNGGRGTGHTGN